MGASSVVRALLLGVGGLLVFGGLASLTLGPAMTGPGLWLVFSGGFLIIAAVLERHRYRSEAAERRLEPPGPGGGETAGPVDARFRPTDEVFLDPTSQRRMRVLLDGRTGERRYVAED
jgi:hypothetical protein